MSTNSSNSDEPVAPLPPRQDEWEALQNKKLTERRIIDLSQGRKQRIGKAESHVAAFDFCMSPAFLATLMNRNPEQPMFSEHHTTFFEPDPEDDTKRRFAEPWCKNVPHRGDRRGFRSYTAHDGTATYAVDDVLHELQKGTPFAVHLFHKPSGRAFTGRVGYAEDDDCEKFAPQREVRKPDEFRLVPLTLDDGTAHGSTDLASRFAGLSYLFHVSDGIATPDVDRESDTFFELDLGVLEELLDADRGDDWPFEEEEEVKDENEFFIDHPHVTDEEKEKWRLVDRAARLVIKDGNLTDYFDNWEELAKHDDQKRLLRQLCLVGLLCLQLEDFCAPPLSDEEADDTKDGEQYLDDVSKSLRAKRKDKYAYPKDEFVHGWNLRNDNDRWRKGHLYNFYPKDSEHVLMFLMDLFRTATHVRGCTDNTQFGRRYRILPTLRTSYMVDPESNADLLNEALVDALDSRDAEDSEDDDVVKGALETFVDELGIKMNSARRFEAKTVHADVAWFEPVWHLDDNVEHEHLLRRSFASSRALKRRVKRGKDETDAGYALRLALACKRRKAQVVNSASRFRLFVGKHKWAVPERDFLDVEPEDGYDPLVQDRDFYGLLLQHAQGLFVLETRKALDDVMEHNDNPWHIATDAVDKHDGCFHMSNKCMAVNANGAPCRNSGKLYRPAFDGSLNRAGFLCDFHCSLVSKDCRVRTEMDFADLDNDELVITSGILLDEDMDDDDKEEQLGELIKAFVDAYNEEEGCPPVKLAMAPLKGSRKPNDFRLVSSRQNRGLLVTYKNLATNIGPFTIESIDDEDKRQLHEYVGGREGRLQWVIDYLDHASLPRAPNYENAYDVFDQNDSDEDKMKKLAAVKVRQLDQYFLDGEERGEKPRLAKASDINIFNYFVPPPPQMTVIRGHFVRPSNPTGHMCRMSLFMDTNIPFESPETYLRHFEDVEQVRQFCDRMNSMLEIVPGKRRYQIERAQAQHAFVDLLGGVDFDPAQAVDNFLALAAENSGDAVLNALDAGQEDSGSDGEGDEDDKAAEHGVDSAGDDADDDDEAAEHGADDDEDDGADSAVDNADDGADVSALDSAVDDADDEDDDEDAPFDPVGAVDNALALFVLNKDDAVLNAVSRSKQRVRASGSSDSVSARSRSRNVFVNDVFGNDGDDYDPGGDDYDGDDYDPGGDDYDGDDYDPGGDLDDDVWVTFSLQKVPERYVAPEMFATVGLFSELAKQKVPHHKRADGRWVKKAWKDFPATDLATNLAGVGAFAMVELGLLQEQYLEELWRDENLMQKYAQVTARTAPRHALTDEADARVVTSLRNKPYLAVSKFDENNAGQRKRSRLSDEVRNDVIEAYDYKYRPDNTRRDVGAQAIEVDRDGEVVNRGREDLQGGNKACGPWTVVVPRDAATPARVTRFLTRKNMDVLQRTELHASFRVPPSLRSVRPLIFSPDGEFAGVERNVTSHLHFGRVLYGFAANEFTRNEKTQVRQIIQENLGAGKKFMCWCTFEEVNGTNFPTDDEEDVLHIDLHMLSNHDLATHSSFQHRPDLNGMSITSMGRKQSSTYFNRDNWQHMPHYNDQSGRTQADYQLYLVVHELFHAIGFRHHIDANAYTRFDADRPLKFLSQMTRPVFFEKQLGNAPTNPVSAAALAQRKIHNDLSEAQLFSAVDINKTTRETRLAGGFHIDKSQTSGSNKMPKQSNQIIPVVDSDDSFDDDDNSYLFTSDSESSVVETKPVAKKKKKKAPPVKAGAKKAKAKKKKAKKPTKKAKKTKAGQEEEGGEDCESKIQDWLSHLIDGNGDDDMQDAFDDEDGMGKAKPVTGGDIDDSGLSFAAAKDVEGGDCADKLQDTLVDDDPLALDSTDPLALETAANTQAFADSGIEGGDSEFDGQFLDDAFSDDDLSSFDSSFDSVGASMVDNNAAKQEEEEPAEAKSAEVKPAEAKPAEVKPAEAKPAEVKPAVQGGGDVAYDGASDIERPENIAGSGTGGGYKAAESIDTDAIVKEHMDRLSPRSAALLLEAGSRAVRQAKKDKARKVAPRRRRRKRRSPSPSSSGSDSGSDSDSYTDSSYDSSSSFMGSSDYDDSGSESDSSDTGTYTGSESDSSGDNTDFSGSDDMYSEYSGSSSGSGSDSSDVFSDDETRRRKKRVVSHRHRADVKKASAFLTQQYFEAGEQEQLDDKALSIREATARVQKRMQATGK